MASDKPAIVLIIMMLLSSIAFPVSSSVQHMQAERKIDNSLLDSNSAYNRVILFSNLANNEISKYMDVTFTLNSPNGFLYFGSVERSKIMDLASLPNVIKVFPDLKIQYNDTRLDSTPSIIQTDMFRIREVLGINAINSSLHIQGKGVNIAIVDTGTDFANPNLDNSYARDSSNIPLALDPDGSGIVLTNTTLSKFVNSTGVYLDLLRNGEGTNISIYLGAITYPYVVVKVHWDITNWRIGDDSEHYIISKSGVYHFGFAFEWTPSGFFLFPTLVVDSQIPGKYDTVYIDFNSAPAVSTMFILERLPFTIRPDFNFYDEKPHRIGDGSEVLASDLNGDNIPDISAGLLGARVLDVFGVMKYERIKYDFDLGALNGPLLLPMDPEGNYVGVMYDFQGHGTQTASNIASKGSLGYDIYGNGTKYRLPGVAPESKIIAIKALYIGDVLYSWLWASGFDYDSNQAKWVYTGNHKADIVSNSWGISVWPLLVSGMGYDVVSILEDALSLPGSFSPNYPGTLFVQAMGNGGPGYGTITVPASSSLAISVGASTSWHVAKQFSSTQNLQYYGGSSSYYDDVIGWSDRGPSPTGEPKPDVVNVGAFGFTPAAIMQGKGDGKNAWSFFGGTSQATPLTAGVAALVIESLRSKGIKFTPSYIKSILMSTAADTNNDPFVQGAGRVNATAAVSYSLGGTDLMKSVFIAQSDATYNNLFQSISTASKSLSSIIKQNFTLRSKVYLANWFAGDIRPGGSATARFNVINPTRSSINISLSSYTFQMIGEARITNVSSPGNSVFINMSRAIGRIPDGTDLIVIRENFPFGSWYNSSISGYYANDITRLRLQVYNWIDRNRDGKPQLDEISIINTNYAWGNSEEVRIGLPLKKFTGTPLLGIYQNPRLVSYWYGETNNTANKVSFTISVFFYKKVHWDILSFDRSSFAIAPNSNVTFESRLNVPINMAPGIYQGYLLLSGSNGQESRVPVSFSIPITPTQKGLPFVFGGKGDGDGVMYSNGAIYGASDFSWRYESGNWRYYKLVVNDKTVNQGTVKIDWSNPETSINIFILNPEGKIIASSVPPGLYKSITREFIQLIPIPPSPSNDYLGYSPFNNLGWGGGFAPSQNNGQTSSILQFPINETGTYTIVVHNTIYAGNSPFEYFNGTVVLNTVLPIQGEPALDLTLPANPVKGILSIGLKLSGEAISSISYSIDLMPRQNVTDRNLLNIDTTKLSDGVHVLHLIVSDIVGHTVERDFQFIVLNNPPVVLVGNPVNGSTVNGIVNITIFPKTPYIRNIMISIDNQTLIMSGNNLSWDSTRFKDGTHTLKVFVSDLAGNNSTEVVHFKTNNQELAAQQDELLRSRLYISILASISIISTIAAVTLYLRRYRR